MRRAIAVIVALAGLFLGTALHANGPAFLSYAVAVAGFMWAASLWRRNPDAMSHSGPGSQIPNTSCRPHEVQEAVTLLYVALIIGAPRTALELSRLSTHVPVLVVLFVLGAAGAVLGLLIFLVGRGMNWARISFLILLMGAAPFILSM